MTYLFYAVVISLVFLIGSSVWSLLVPERRTWPPVRRSGFIYRMGSVLGPGISIALFVLPILDGNSFVLEHWSRFPVGSVLLIVGAYFSLGGVFHLGMERTNGHEGELMQDGPYRYTRNPQYVGAALAYIGLGLICNSALGLASSLLSCIWWGLLPFVEEPWLREKLGAPYEAYTERVPRFLSLGVVRRLRSQGE